MTISNLVTPSAYYIARLLQLYLVSHPLFYNPLVTNGATGTAVGIDAWRLYEGFPVNSNIFYCTITPHSLSEPAHPRSSNVTSHYTPYNLGKNGYDEVVYFTKVAFDYLYPISPGDYIDTYSAPVIRNWNDTQNHPDPTVPLSGAATTSVEYNPIIEVISEYLEVTRLAINDKDQQRFYLPYINVKSIQCTHSALLTGDWDKDKNLILQRGYVMIETTAYVPRQWRPAPAPPDDIKVEIRTSPPGTLYTG